MNATTATATRPVRGTTKTLRQAGIDLSKPVTFHGFHAKTARVEGQRFERVETDFRGSAGILADGTRFGLGGTATKFWMAQAEAPVAEAPAADAGDDLDSMKFAQLMELAKLHNVPGRGTARIAALREGVRAARREAELAYASVLAG